MKFKKGDRVKYTNVAYRTSSFFGMTGTVTRPSEGDGDAFLMAVTFDGNLHPYYLNPIKFSLVAPPPVNNKD